MSDSAIQISPKTREADGLTIRYAETESAADETVLLLNPWPESLFAWNTIWARLAESAKLVAIDLPGFGRSQRRGQLLSPHAMGAFLQRLVDEWELGQPHVIGPDVGTGAVLFAAADDRDLFASAVVGSGGASFPLEVTGALKDIIEAPDLSGFQGIDGRDIVAGALGAIQKHALLETVREDYLQSYAGERFVQSAPYVRSYPVDLPVLAERLDAITIPVQIIAGRHDSLVPPSNAEFLHTRLPDSKLDILDTDHFVWEDASDDYLRLARSWIGTHSHSARPMG